MEGRWGRRVNGSVRRGTKFTRFRLEFTITNGVTIFEAATLTNEELERNPKWYGNTLDMLLSKIEGRLKLHHL